MTSSPASQTMISFRFRRVAIQRGLQESLGNANTALMSITQACPYAPCAAEPPPNSLEVMEAPGMKMKELAVEPA